LVRTRTAQAPPRCRCGRSSWLGAPRQLLEHTGHLASDGANEELTEVEFGTEPVKYPGVSREGYSGWPTGVRGRLDDPDRGSVRFMRCPRLDCRCTSSANVPDNELESRSRLHGRWRVLAGPSCLM